MKLKLNPVLLIFTILSTSTTADYCEDNFQLSELPHGILGQALSMITTGTIIGFLGCLHDVDVPMNDVKFWYFSRKNRDVPILLDQQNPKEIDPRKDTVILIPGWLCNVTNDRVPQLKNAYLKRADLNVIGIDWTARGIDLYTKSFCAIPKVAKIIGNFLCSTPRINIGKLHLVGHSMGGQIAGLTGQEVQKQCDQKLGRITGLDPAGPLYQIQRPKNRLDASDAKFVDVIHSNQGLLGYYGVCGTADFYPNCGTFQRGCMKITISTSPSEIINLPLKTVACNHLRCIDYFIESIESDSFVAKSCKSCAIVPQVCVPDVIGGTKAIMGEGASTRTKGKYYLKTNKKKPFALN